MLQVIGCFVDAHDHRLVVLAALICSLASTTAIQLLCHAQRQADVRGRLMWVGVAAAAGGSGVWATHFIAMLAFEPGLTASYDLTLTIVSLFYAVTVLGVGFGLSTWTALPLAPIIGGAVVGSGVAAMHYTGMAAYEIAGHVVWNTPLVAVSIVIGIVFGAAAHSCIVTGASLRRQLIASTLLVLAICSHHFIAMGAVQIVPDPRVLVTPAAIPSSFLAVAVALASMAILLFAMAALLVDLRDRRRGQAEAERLRSLANAAVEGLLVCRGDLIVSANQSFATLAGEDAADIVGKRLAQFLPSQTTRAGLASNLDATVEGDLRQRDGTLIPAEFILRPLAYGSQSHSALAVRDLRARRKAEKEIAFLAQHDALTGLDNRASFHRRLDRDIARTETQGGSLAVLCLDLDRFKEVNDLFGHSAGDQLLQDFAETVGGLLDDTQLIGRLGGDEFAILARVEQPVAAGRLAERVIEALDTHRSAAPRAQVSIGIATFPEDARDRAGLLQAADTALYQAKAEGRNTYRFFEAKMGEEARDRRQMESDLRCAVEAGQMVLVYQPQIRVSDRRLLGFETLLRWTHPVRGAVPPSVFVPFAEESGAIVAIGEWVLRESCREAASWRQPLTIAVNVSPVQIHAQDFLTILQDTLAKTGLAPERLEIEITENALVRDPARALTTLKGVKALGVRVAMDDFGTGYSSMSNLRQFPFDRIKIDRSFIKSVGQNDQAAAIVRSVLGLGRGLGLPVVAEGVETAQELAFLESENCAEVQGYLFGRPQPISRFAALMEGASGWVPETAEAVSACVAA